MGDAQDSSLARGSLVDPPLPSDERILARASCLAAVALRVALEHVDREEAGAMIEDVRAWMRGGTGAALEERERAIVDAPYGAIDEGRRLDGHFLGEGAAVLASVLGLFDLPPHDVRAEAFDVAQALGFLGRAPRVARMPESAVDLLAQRLFAIRWRLAQYGTDATALDFADFAKTAWFGPFDTAGIPLARGDLSVFGRAISEAAAEDVAVVYAVADERWRAARWLRAGDAPYESLGDVVV